MPQKHINWADSAKGITILAVVLGHIATPLTNFIFSWHMPMFFFLSGFFLKKPDSYKNKFIEDMKKLMIPYLIFGLVGLLAELIKRRLFPNYSFITPNINLADELKGIFIWMDITRMHTYGFVLWFLPTLLWSRTLVRWLLFKVKNFWFVIAISLGFYLLLINQKSFILPLAIDKGLLVTIWVVLGFYSFNYFNKIRFYILYIYTLACLGILLLLPIPIFNLAFKYGPNPIYNLIYSLIIILIILAGCKLVGDQPYLRWLRYFGISSLIIFVLHPYTNNLAYIIISKYYPSHWVIEFILSLMLLFVILKVQEYYQNHVKNI